MSHQIRILLLSDSRLLENFAHVYSFSWTQIQATVECYVPSPDVYALKHSGNVTSLDRYVVNAVLSAVALLLLFTGNRGEELFVGS
jgi:hypothetical protein